MSEQDLTAPVEYRTIPDCPGTRFGDDGSVWSCWLRTWGREMSDEWHQLKPIAHRVTDSYVRAKVTIFYRGKVRQRHVARLILEAFRGPCPPGMEACHNDGNPLNNRLSNLRWDTRLGNIADKKRHGTDNSGSRHGMSRFTEDDIREMRRMRSEGAKLKDIAQRFGADLSGVSKIVRNKCWTHI